MRKVRHLGFTGTRHIESSGFHVQALKYHLANLKSEGYGVLHHGDCVGGDAVAHRLALELDYEVVIHPPRDERHRAFCKGAECSAVPKPYLDRNQDIVDSCGRLIAMPRGPENSFPRSGTWATIRYARKSGVPVDFV